MKFGPVPVDAAIGCHLAHATATPAGTLRKGALIDAAMAAALKAAGLDSVIAVRLDPGDVHEDAAAFAIAEALAGPGITLEAPATGRCNLFAAAAGLFEADAAIVAAVNAVDPAITLATRPNHRGVEQHRMVATVKIIPFAVPGAALAAAVAIAAGGTGLAVRPYRPKRVAAIATLLPSLKTQVIAKTNRALAARLAPAGASIARDIRVPHDAAALAAALGSLGPDIDMAVIFGASAVIDEADVVPMAIRGAGGAVVHFGMPVDPGNLLVLGRLGDGRPVVGAPGCARSPRENGFDFVLERLLADRPPSAAEIAGLGVGGLLMDIVSRPAPRGGAAAAEDPKAPQVGIVILAAGRSSRFADGFKLVADWQGQPMVRKVAETALAAGAAGVTVVVGHRAEEVRAALAGLDLGIIDNPDYADGQSTSVKAGLAALPASVEAAVVMLGDMPAVTAEDVRAVIAAYRPADGSLIVVPTHGGQRGNPLLWSRRLFADIAGLDGDSGARQILADHRDSAVTVERGPSVLFDVDTVEALSGPAP